MQSIISGHDHSAWLRRLIMLGAPALVVSYLVLGNSPLSGPMRFMPLPVLVAAVAVVQLGAWFARGWFSVTGSTLFTASATLALTIACLSPANPLVGMLGATLFAALGGYVVLFHPRSAYAVFGSAALVVAVLGWRIESAGDPWLAASALVTVAIVIASSLTICVMVRDGFHIDVTDDDLEPLTGLLNEAAYRRAVASLMTARGREEDRYLAVTVVDMDQWPTLAGVKGRRTADRARIAIARAVRGTVRRGTAVAHPVPNRLLLAEVMSAKDPAGMANRIGATIAATPPCMTASIGTATASLDTLASLPPDLVIDRLTAAAGDAAADARRAGGGQARHVHVEIIGGDFGGH